MKFPPLSASKVASSTKVEIADTITFHSSGDLVLATNTKPILSCGSHFRILNIAVLKTGNQVMKKPALQTTNVSRGQKVTSTKNDLRYN